MLSEFNKTLNHEIKKSNEVAPTWYSMLEGEKNLPLDPQIIACEDKLEGYRNKVEFTVGRIYEPAREGHDELWNQEAPICVGFNRSNLTKGIEFVEQPDDIKVNSKESIIAAKQFEQIVKNHPDLPPFHRSSAKGFWRILLYRESKVTKQVLICVVVSKATEVNPVPEISAEIKAELVSQFAAGTTIGENGLTISSLSVIASDDLSGAYREGDYWEVLSGIPHYEEVLCGLKFTVSPFAFF